MRYEFVIATRISETARAAFPEFECAPSPTGCGTSLWGPVVDDSQLRDYLARFADLGLTVVEMRQLPD